MSNQRASFIEPFGSNSRPIKEYPHLKQFIQQISTGASARQALLFFDTETTGLLDDENVGIVEIGAILIHPADFRIESISTLVNPGVPISKEATKIHGITDADVADAPTFTEIYNDLEEFFGAGPNGAIISGFNTDRFDVAVINKLCRKHELPELVSDNQPSLDVKKLWDRVSNYDRHGKLTQLAEIYGCAEKDAHRAIADTRMAMGVLDGLIRDYGIVTAKQAMMNPHPFIWKRESMLAKSAVHRLADMRGEIPPATLNISDSLPATRDEAIRRAILNHLSTQSHLSRNQYADIAKSSSVNATVAQVTDFLSAMVQNGTVTAEQVILPRQQAILTRHLDAALAAADDLAQMKSIKMAFEQCTPAKDELRAAGFEEGVCYVQLRILTMANPEKFAMAIDNRRAAQQAEKQPVASEAANSPAEDDAMMPGADAQKRTVSMSQLFG